jgi:preprotein translocase subunit Sec63
LAAEQGGGVNPVDKNPASTYNVGINGEPMRTFDEISAARRVLDLPETATMRQIKSQYRRLLAKWHPDRCSGADQQEYAARTREIIAAYKVISRYCSEYEYSFAEDVAQRHLTPEEWWLRRFGNAPMWRDEKGVEE